MTARTDPHLWQDITAALATQVVKRRHLGRLAGGDRYQTVIEQCAELIAGIVTAPREVSLTLTYPVNVRRLLAQALSTHGHKAGFDFNEEYGFLVETIKGPRGQRGAVTKRCVIVRLHDDSFCGSTLRRWLRTQGLAMAPFEWLLALHRKYQHLKRGPYALPAQFKRNRREEWQCGSDASHIGRWEDPLRYGGPKYFQPASDPCWGRGTLVLAIPLKDQG